MQHATPTHNKHIDKRLFCMCPPEAIENGTIWMQADHAVFDGDSVDERLLVVQEVGVGDPELVGDPVVQGQVEGDPYVGQTFVPPVLLEIHGQRVVL